MLSKNSFIVYINRNFTEIMLDQINAFIVSSN